MLALRETIHNLGLFCRIWDYTALYNSCRQTVNSLSPLLFMHSFYGEDIFKDGVVHRDSTTWELLFSARAHVLSWLILWTTFSKINIDQKLESFDTCFSTRFQKYYILLDTFKKLARTFFILNPRTKVYMAYCSLNLIASRSYNRLLLRKVRTYWDIIKSVLPPNLLLL